MRRLHSFHSLFFSSLIGSAFSFFLSSFVVCMAVHLYTHRRQAFAPASSLKAAFCIFSINLNLDIGQIQKREDKLLTSNQAMYTWERQEFIFTTTSTSQQYPAWLLSIPKNKQCYICIFPPSAAFVSLSVKVCTFYFYFLKLNLRIRLATQQTRTRRWTFFIICVCVCECACV